MCWSVDGAVVALLNKHSIESLGKKKLIHAVGGTLNLKSLFIDFLCQYEDSATSPEHWRFFCRRAGEKGSNALEQTLPQGISSPIPPTPRRSSSSLHSLPF